MKRVGLSRFNPLEVSRKVQQCLRFEGVNANGVANTDTTELSNERDYDEQISGDTGVDQREEDTRNKSNILNTIKRKLKKTKRNKRCDARVRSESLSNVCQSHSENCESHTCCAKQFRTRKTKQGDKCSVWPITASILRCQNHQQINQIDDVAELIPCSKEDAEICCSRLESPSPKSNSENRSTVATCSKLMPHASSSLSNISCDVGPVASSLDLKVESETDLSRTPYISLNDTNMQISIYSSPLYTADESDKKDVELIALPLVPSVGNLTQELYKLSKYGWYWGPINRSEAESKLVDQPDGAFLVRDSSDDRYILSLSFRSYGKTLHTRIEHSSGLFSFYSQPDPESHASIVELIQQSMCFSQSGVFCYSRSRSPGSPSFPVRLTKPISRFTQVRSLQYLCRFVIRQFTRYDHIQKLPLPSRIKGYLEEGHY